MSKSKRKKHDKEPRKRKGRGEQPKAAKSMPDAPRRTWRIPNPFRTVMGTNPTGEPAKTHDEIMQGLERKQMIFNGLLAFFSGLGFFIATWQGCQITRSNDIADDTAKKQLRAYVVVERVNMNNIVVDDDVRASVTVKNVGQTPAYKLSVHVDVSLVPRSFRGSMSEPAIAPANKTPIQTTLGPGRPATVSTAPRSLPDDAKKRLRSGELAGWVHGIARYKDVFGIPHFTEFRFLQGGRKNEMGQQMVVVDEGNETDDK